MSNLSALQDHIEASAPCSLYSVAVWVEDQLTVSTVEFASILHMLASAGNIELSSDDSGITIDLI